MLNVSPQVDVIFPEDVGFLAAIRTFMSKTKRPIILTTNGEQQFKAQDPVKHICFLKCCFLTDPLFGRRLKGHFNEIHFQTPSLVRKTNIFKISDIVLF